MDANKAKAIRYFLGETQAAFAKRIGVTASTICMIEKKQRGISDALRAKLVRIEIELPSDFTPFYMKFRETT
ncbi:helix-turn-helix transcriptional regulator [Halalkalibacter oceani]|uniref:helix-turn-helix transcriptional regulator n=1 Tax=Halalkalibacter oceani TaxID=1653776 RepID=UPI003393BC73